MKTAALSSRRVPSYVALLTLCLLMGSVGGCAGGGGVAALAAAGDLDRLHARIPAEPTTQWRTGPGARALIEAIQADQHAAVVMLLREAGVSANAHDAEGFSALHIAAETASLETTEALVEAGAELNARGPEAGRTPLWLAAAADHEPGVYGLIRAGAVVSLSESGGTLRTPLHAAVDADAWFAVRLLLQAGADPYAPDSAGDSPLAKAAAKNETEPTAMFRLALAGRGGEIPRPQPRASVARSAGTSSTRFLTQKRPVAKAPERTYSLADLTPARRPADTDAKPASPRRPGVKASDLYGRRIAVVIGINDYRRWPDLEGARRDSQRMAEELRAQGFDEVIEVYDREATRARMLAVLGQELAARTQADDLAFVFFAGHGDTETLADGSKRGYLVPVDASPTSIATTGLSMATLRDLAHGLRAKHVFFAMDSCYSGLGFVRGIGVRKDPQAAFLEKLTSRRVVQMLTAGTEGELAIERDGEGLFTSYLIRALRGEADFDENGVVTAGEIGVFVRPQVSAASGNRQTPQFGTIEGTGEVVFPIPE